MKHGKKGYSKPVDRSHSGKNIHKLGGSGKSKLCKGKKVSPK